MERLNKKTLSFPAMRITRVLATLGTVLVLAACGKGDGGGGGGAVTPIPPSSCGSCTGITSPQLLTTVSMEAASRVMAFTNMQIFGDAGYFTPTATGNYYNTYRGPIGMSGTLVVTTTAYDTYGGGCVIPAGTYYVQSNSQGVMDMGMLQVQSLISTSGAIEFAIQGMLHNQGTRLYSQIVITRVNGVQCSGMFGDSFN